MKTQRNRDYLLEAILILVMAIPMTIANPMFPVFLGVGAGVLSLFMATRAREKIKQGPADQAESASRIARYTTMGALALVILNAAMILILELTIR